MNERIQLIIKFLQEPKLNEIMDQNMKTALEAFDRFLTECKEFMKKFVDAGLR